MVDVESIKYIIMSIKIFHRRCLRSAAGQLAMILHRSSHVLAMSSRSPSRSCSTSFWQTPVAVFQRNNYDNITTNRRGRMVTVESIKCVSQLKVFAVAVYVWLQVHR